MKKTFEYLFEKYFGKYFYLFTKSEIINMKLLKIIKMGLMKRNLLIIIRTFLKIMIIQLEILLMVNLD